MPVMKSALAFFTPRPIRRAVIRLGQFFAAVEKHKGPAHFPSQEAAFQTLKKLGWRPRSCIDVGAYHGEWTAMFRSLFPECRVLMVEAQQSKTGTLEAVVREMGNSVEFAPALLGASDGTEVEFNEMETGSSVFSEASQFQRATVKKRLAKLDTVLASHPGFRTADCLKIDTQGYELQVLAGAEQLLQSVDAVLLEVSLLQVNAGCPLLSDVVAYMAERGFAVFDFCSQIRRRDGVLWQTDLLFLRSGGSIHIEPRLTHETWG
jgi:FkbM family methyltransferase